jgi:hypothetical protein
MTSGAPASPEIPEITLGGMRRLNSVKLCSVAT